MPKPNISDTEIVSSDPEINFAPEIEVPDLHEINVSYSGSYNDSFTGKKFLDKFNENNLSSTSLFNDDI